MTEENIQKLEQMHKEQNEQQEDEKKSEDLQKEQLEEMLSQGFKAIKMRKGIKDVESINPLTMRIEDIFNFPDDIPVNGVRKDEISLDTKTEEMKAQIRDIVAGSIKKEQADHLIKDLFSQEFEQDSWLTTQFNLKGHISKDSMLEKKMLSQGNHVTTGTKDKEEQEIYQDINFQRDLGPLSRQMCLNERGNRAL